MDHDSLLDNVKKRLSNFPSKMDIWPGLAWHVYHLSTEDLELTESGVNAESRDDDRLGQLPAPHPAIPSHVRVCGGPEEKPAAGEDSFVRSPN